MTDKVILKFINNTRTEIDRNKEALANTSFENLYQVGLLQGKIREAKSSLIRLEEILQEEVDI